jgi:Dyp-type peroxidase family
MPTALDLHDIQGNILRAYRQEKNGRFLFFCIRDAAAGRAFLGMLAPLVTGAEWKCRPEVTTNVALTHAGLRALELPADTLDSFPSDFSQGMRARARDLGDTGQSGPENWDEPWRSSRVHVLVSCYSAQEERLRRHCEDLIAKAPQGVAELPDRQKAARILQNGQAVEHFGFADGFSNPAIEGMPAGANKNLLGNPDGHGGFSDIPAGEFILGYPGIGREQRPLPKPTLLGVNGTYLVFRKLAQDVKAFRTYVDQQCAILNTISPGHDREFLAAKMVGRWRDGSSLILYPTKPARPDVTNKFDYNYDPDGALCPLGAHVRRTNPRSSLGVEGQLTMRRRIIRRSIAYGPFVPELETPDETPRGIVFLAYMSGIDRQFEFVQQQWINEGDDFQQGRDKDPLAGDNDCRGRMVVPGDGRAGRPPFLCTKLPRFVTVKGGDYFFAPGLTALSLLAEGRIQGQN